PRRRFLGAAGGRRTRAAECTGDRDRSRRRGWRRRALREGVRAMTRERGTAVIMAMLIVAAAATLVSGAMWQQSALIRETENELAYTQAKWLLRGAIDWAGVILQEDARTSSVDHRGEPWAVPLADTRLNENDGRAAAYLAGVIDDEQAKFNLRNLVAASGIQGAEVLALRRLLA